MSYGYLLTILDRIQADLDEAKRVSHELFRDGMLTGECRLLGEQRDAVAYAAQLVRVRAECEDRITLARRAEGRR